MELAYFISDFLGAPLVMRGQTEAPRRYIERFDPDERAWVEDGDLVQAFDRGSFHDLRSVSKGEADAVIKRQSRIAV